MTTEILSEFNRTMDVIERQWRSNDISLGKRASGIRQAYDKAQQQLDARVERVKNYLDRIESCLGPTPADCCEGCKSEMGTALSYARAARAELLERETA